jgi:small neutral amino acid transporter SnatA (MarC family)
MRRLSMFGTVFALLPLLAAAFSPFTYVSVFLAFQVQLQKHTRQRLERAGM